MASGHRPLQLNMKPSESARGQCSPRVPSSPRPGFATRAKDDALRDTSTVDWTAFMYMLLNFTASTCLVVVNKILMDKFHFRYATTLTCFHLFSTFFLLVVVSKLGAFEVKALPLKQVWKLAAGTMGFICLTNLSLQHNSVGFYQVMKVMTTPTVVIIEALLYQKYLETQLKIALLPVCLGVIVTTVTDFRLNAVGAAYAVAGVIVTSFYQIWSGTLQKSLDCNALQLQYYVAPLAAVFVLPFIPIFDNYSFSDLDSIWFFEFTPANLTLIATTGVIGFLVNISIFLVIGRSSPVSYNVLGHGKTIFVLLSDFLIFGRPVTMQSSTGILLTMIGVFWYTQRKLEKSSAEADIRARSEEKAAALISLSTDAGSDEMEDLLKQRGQREA